MTDFRKLLLAAALVGVSTTAGAAGQNVGADDPEALAEIIRDMGYKAAVDVDDLGDPMIRSSVNGSDVYVLFYGCEDGEDCKTLLFRVGYDLENGTTLDVVNAWNKDKLYSRAYLDDEQDPWLEMAVNLFGGVSRENFADTFDWWDVMVGEFEDYIDF